MRIATALLLLLTIPSFGYAQTHTPGTWIKRGAFSQANVACFQVWTCDSGPVLHPPKTTVVTTPDKTTTGVCSADGGPKDSCNSCVTGRPSDKCEYWLEAN